MGTTARIPKHHPAALLTSRNPGREYMKVLHFDLYFVQLGTNYYTAVLRIHMFLGLLDPDPDPLV
jgi:hypothetical protein